LKKGTYFVARKCPQCALEFDIELKHVHVVDKSNPVCPIHDIILEEPKSRERSLRRGWTKEPINQFINLGDMPDSVRNGSQQSHDVDLSDVGAPDEDY